MVILIIYVNSYQTNGLHNRNKCKVISVHIIILIFAKPSMLIPVRSNAYLV